MTVEIISHFLKEAKVTGKKVKGRGNTDKPSPLYLSFLIEWPLGQLVISDCRLSDGYLRPPARPGGWSGVFFPQVWLPFGLDTPLADRLYCLCGEMARQYGLELRPQQEALIAWMPSEKVLKNMRNLTTAHDMKVRE